MTDPTWEVLAILALVAVLVTLAVYDLDVARELRSADLVLPAIPFLSLVKWIVYGATVTVIIAALLGVSSAWFLLTGNRIIPQPFGLIGLVAICIVPSVMVARLRAWIREQQ